FLPFEPLLPCVSPRFARGVVKWLPRTVGVLATVPMAIVMASARSGSLPVWLRVLPVAVGAIFLVFVVFRRRAFGEFVEYTMDPPDVVYGYRRFDALDRRGWTLLALLAAVPILLFVALAIDPRLSARTIATPALTLFATGSWNLSMGFLLVY